MKQKIPGAVAVVILIVAGVLLVLFGWRKVSGSDNDVTAETNARYQNMSKSSGGGGSSQPTHGAPPAGAPAGSAGNP